MVQGRFGGRRWISAGVALTVAASTLAFMPVTAQAAEGPAPVEQRSGVTADALPTVQLDSGMVWSQDMIGTTVYAGGTFSNVRPPGSSAGTNLTPRSNLLAYDIRTGDLVTGFAPSVNGTVKVVKASPDGSRIYVGGSFNKANSTTRYNLAAFDAKTGALISTFNAAAGGSYVNALAVTDTTVYVGGLLSAGAGVARKNLMAFSTAGKLLAWAPTTDLQVDTMVLAPNSSKLIIGGRFSQVNGASQRGLAALDRTNGSILPWEAPSTVVNGSATGTDSGKAGIWSLSADANAVYGTGWVYASKAVGNLEGVFSASPDSGAIRWIADCHGDHYGVYSDGTTVYSTSHEHACETMGGYPQKNPAPGNMHNATAVTAAAKGTLLRSENVNDIYADWSGWAAPAAVNWYPDWYTGTASSLGQAGFSVVGNGDYVAVGGEFIGLNNKLQNGLTRFAKLPSGGAKQAPRLSGDSWVPKLSSVRSGSVRVAIPANWDRDDLSLTYQFYRVGRSTPVYTTTQKASFWNLPTLTFTDTGLAVGSTVSYRVVASDPDGNISNSKTVSVQVSDYQPSPYVDAVLNDGASLYYRLGTSGSAADMAGTIDGVTGSGVGSAAGALANDTDGASTFNGTDAGLVASSARVSTTPAYSMELWFKTATAGGKIAGYGGSQNGSSNNYDRHLYLTNDGRLKYGNYLGYTATITSANAYNDNVWHHVVASQSSSGMKLYVDGNLLGTDGASTAEGYNGYWRVGGDNLNGWPDQPSNQWFTGSVDEFAIYPTAISGQVVRTHYDLGVGVLPPAASFTSTGANQDVSFDGSASTVSQGRTVSSYAWDFGDSTPLGSGATVSHSYAQPGSYTVKLTVTDNVGSTGTVSKTVKVSAPHAAPVAVVGKTVSGLTANLDGTGSTTSDGATIAGYAWTFDDGSTSTEAKPSRVYAASGSYDVSLVVTDSTGAESAATTVSVTVSHTAPVASFTTTVVGRQLSVDASASTASDGASLSYAWAWDDQTTVGSGKTADHAYTSDGTYNVKLTVTDSLGSSVSTSKAITVVGVPLVAKDSFGRSVTSGWGTADTGGSWTSATGQSVSDGVGKLSIAKSATRTTYLPISKSDVDSRFDVSLDKVADGSGAHWNYVVHRTTNGDLRVKLRYAANGSVNVGLAKMVGTTETLLTNKGLAGYTQTAGSTLSVRLQTVTENGSTVLRTKVWANGDPEPSAWTLSATSTDAVLQGAGQIGFSGYGSGTITNGPVVFSVDNVEVR